MEAWYLIILLKAFEFCSHIDTPKSYCVNSIMECYLDDNKKWCEEDFWDYYDGI